MTKGATVAPFVEFNSFSFQTASLAFSIQVDWPRGADTEAERVHVFFSRKRHGLGHPSEELLVEAPLAIRALV